MAGELVPLVMLPRYSTYAGATTLYTIAMDVSEYERAILNVWRGPLPDEEDCGFDMYFEESTDSIHWTPCSGYTNSPNPVDPDANTEEQYVPDLKKRWFRIKLELTTVDPYPFPIVTCWAVGFLERRES